MPNTELHARADAGADAGPCCKESDYKGPTVMSHEEYLNRLGTHIESHKNDPYFSDVPGSYKKQLAVITNINLDPVIPLLQRIYSPSGQGAPRDPGCMLRSM
ncbi:MAG: hypothetical protein GY710_24800, partial [Desulfobacteraceae bacterium]|nr:hypothetical protein [Desulfobacteraceae bacterium]